LCVQFNFRSYQSQLYWNLKLDSYWFSQKWIIIQKILGQHEIQISLRSTTFICNIFDTAIV